MSRRYILTYVVDRPPLPPPGEPTHEPGEVDWFGDDGDDGEQPAPLCPVHETPPTR